MCKNGEMTQCNCPAIGVLVVCSWLFKDFFRAVLGLPPMRETWVQSLGQEDPLEKEMATHSSILAWRIPWAEEQVGYSPPGRKESDTTERLHFTFTLCL